MDGGAPDNWNDYEQPPPSDSTYGQQDKPPIISYGSTETNSNNPFHSTNPFATDVNASLVQPPAADYYSYDVTQDQQWK